MNEVPLISLLLAIISVLTVFTLIQYNQLNPHRAAEHHFSRSAEVQKHIALAGSTEPTLVNPHANSTNLSVFLLSES